MIDLAMMQARLPLLRQAVAKAEQAYGSTIRRDLGLAIDALHDREGWLERCMHAMRMTVPRAVVWQRAKALRRALKPERFNALSASAIALSAGAGPVPMGPRSSPRCPSGRPPPR